MFQNHQMECECESCQRMWDKMIAEVRKGNNAHFVKRTEMMVDGIAQTETIENGKVVHTEYWIPDEMPIPKLQGNFIMLDFECHSGSKIRVDPKYVSLVLEGDPFTMIKVEGDSYEIKDPHRGTHNSVANQIELAKRNLRK